MRSAFVAVLDLARAYYRQAVRPVLDADLPGLPHSAALMGPGSEVLGFDTERSTDHDWGPRVLLFLRPADRAAHGAALHGAALHEALAARLPATFGGYPTSGPAGHRVVVTHLGTWSAVGWASIPVRRSTCSTGCPRRRSGWRR